MKLVKFNPSEVKKIASFFNGEIEKCEEKYIMFIFNDIYDELKDVDVFCKAYEDLLTKNDLPFAFFPYYIHFNKVLTEYIKFPNPILHIENENNKFDIVGQPSLGVLVLDVEKLKSKNFKFSCNYEEAFYVQEIVMFCNKVDLYFSNLYFYDVYKSWTYLKNNVVKGYLPVLNSFKEEKTKFYQTYKQEDEGINNFLEKVKLKMKQEIKLDLPTLEPLSEEEIIK